mgnify:CR=1 FL=1
MSIASLCTGDTVVKLTKSTPSVVSAYGGDPGVFAGSGGIDCKVEELSASDVAAFSARGMTVSHRVFFSTDQSLSPKHNLHWTATNGNETACDVTLNVEGYYQQHSPRGNLKLWIAMCKSMTQRGDITV